MKPIPIYGFDKLSDDAFSTKTDYVISKMTENPNFPDATSRVTKLKTAKSEFDTARIAAQDGGTAKTNEKKKKRKVVQKALKDLALYVQLNCNEDVAIMLTSGFDGRSDGTPTPDPGAPENFKVEAGKNSGTVDLSVDSFTNAKVYVFDYALVVDGAEPAWKTVVGEKEHTIRDLIPGKKYMFRAAIKGSNEILIYSEIIYRFVS